MSLELAVLLVNPSVFPAAAADSSTNASTDISTTNSVAPATASVAADWVVRTWDTSEGLPHNVVNALVQTSDGFLWIGTSGGLARFDGVSFQSFGLEEGLSSVYIASLLEDRHGVLWVGTSVGLSRLDNGRFTSFGKADGFPVANVLALAMDRDDTLWIGTQKGLFRSRNGKCEAVPPSDGLPGNVVRALLVDSSGVLWVSLPLPGIFKKAGDKFVSARIDSKPTPPGYSLYEDRQGVVWVGSTTGHLWRWRDQSWTRFDGTNGLPKSNLDSLAQGPGSELFIGARNAGLYRFSDGRAESLVRQGVLAGETVRTLLVDRESILWVGTSSGLHRLVRPLVKNWGVAQGIDQPIVNSVAQDNSGGLWVCTQDRGIFRSQEGRFSKLVDPAVSGNFPFTYTSATTTDGSLWVGGEGCLFRFRPGQKTEAYHDGPIHAQAIRALCADGNALWIGTYNAALFKFENSKIQVMGTNDSFAGEITSLAMESPGTLWIGTGAGLYRWEKGTPSLCSASASLLTGNVMALHRDPDNTLWIGTRGGGLARLKNGKVFNITTRHGLIDNLISQIVSDNPGFLWLGCSHGIMRLARNELNDLAEGRIAAVHPLVVGRDDGMIKAQCSGGHSPTAIRASTGHLLFPTSAGLVEIDPASFGNVTTVLPQATIEEVRLDDRKHDPGSSLVIAPGNHRLEISYTAPSMRGTEWVRFRYRLDPLDKDWVTAGSQRSVAYADLLPGHYDFHVTASDAKGFWNDKAASLSLIVQPALWQTLWFRALALLAICAAAFAWYRQRLSRLEIKQQQQQAFTRQLINAQEAERARLARELHDDITQQLARLAIDAGRVERGSATSPGPQETMRTVREGLVRVSEDVHALSYNLHPSLLEDLGLAQALQAECEHFSKQHGIPCQVSVRDLPTSLPAEIALGLFRIGQEALRNTGRHAKATAVDLTLRPLDNGLQLAVQDDGIGFDPSLKRQRVSLGLAGMRERIDFLGGELDIESAPGEGTTIVAWVPLQKGM